MPFRLRMKCHISWSQLSLSSCSVDYHVRPILLQYAARRNPNNQGSQRRGGQMQRPKWRPIRSRFPWGAKQPRWVVLLRCIGPLSVRSSVNEERYDVRMWIQKLETVFWTVEHHPIVQSAHGQWIPTKGAFDDQRLGSKQGPSQFTNRRPTRVRDSHDFCEEGASLEGWLVKPNDHGRGLSVVWTTVTSLQDSEKAHGRSLTLLRLFSSNPVSRAALKLLYKPRRSLPVELFGHTYAHPFGLAAGMDKNAKALRG